MSEQEQSGLSAEIKAVATSIGELRSDVREQAKTYITRAEYEATTKGAEQFITTLSERVRKIEDRSEWLVRTVGGVIITALITAFLVMTRARGLG